MKSNAESKPERKHRRKAAKRFVWRAKDSYFFIIYQGYIYKGFFIIYKGCTLMGQHSLILGSGTNKWNHAEIGLKI